MTSVRVRLACLTVSLLLSGAALAQVVGVSTRLGGHGLGLELSRSVTPQLRARIGLNTHEQEWATAFAEPYSFDRVFRSVSALLDWHPWGDSFRLSGGMLIGADASEDERATGEEVARPGYLGVGWEGGADQRFGLMMDLGLVFSGLTDVEAGGQRGLIPVGALQEGDFSRLWGGLQNQAVFSLGMKYRF